MKKRTLLKVFFLVCLMIIMNSSIVAAWGDKTKFSGERNMIPPPIFMGAEWYSGPNDIMHDVRCRVVQFIVETDDTRVTGVQTVIINNHLEQTEPYSSGRLWGKFVIEPEVYPGSCWTGHFFGEAKANGAWNHRYFGYGTGELDGLKFRAYSENTDFRDIPKGIPARTWSIEGFIIE